MQFLEEMLQSVNEAQSISSILAQVDQLEKEINAGGEVGLTMAELDKIADAARRRMAELESESTKQLEESERKLERAKRASEFDESVVTIDYLKELDGKAVWIRDDYLSMRGIASDLRQRSFLDRVAEVKAEARKAGVEFNA